MTCLFLSVVPVITEQRMVTTYVWFCKTIYGCADGPTGVLELYYVAEHQLWFLSSY